MYYRMCLFFLCLLFPSVGFSQEYVVVKQGTPLYTTHNGTGELTSHLKDGFMELEVLERKNKRIHVIARDDSRSPCLSGVKLAGFELKFWIDKSAPIDVLKEYTKWEFPDNSVVELAAGTPITKEGAGAVIVPVKAASKGRSFRRSYVPKKGRKYDSVCWGKECPPEFRSKKGLKYNGTHYYKSHTFYEKQIKTQCLSIKGELKDAVRIPPSGDNVGLIGRRGGYSPVIQFGAGTTLYTAQNEAIGRVLRTTNVERWKVSGDFSCLDKDRSKIEICVKTSDIIWGQTELPEEDKYPRSVVKRNTKFYPTETSKKAVLHLRKAKGYTTLLVLEEAKNRVKVRLIKNSENDEKLGCYQNFWVPDDLRLEFWVNRTSLLDITTQRTNYYLEGTSVDIAAGQIVTKKGIELEEGKLYLNVNSKHVGKFVEKDELRGFTTFFGPAVEKNSNFGLPGRTPGRRKTRPVFFTSKDGIQYGKHRFKFPPSEIYEKGFNKEVGTRCWRIVGEILTWENSKEPARKPSQPFYRIDWDKRVAITGSTVFSSSGKSMGIVRRGLSERAKPNIENKKLLCKPFEFIKGQKVKICLEDQALVDQTKKLK